MSDDTKTTDDQELSGAVVTVEPHEDTLIPDVSIAFWRTHNDDVDFVVHVPLEPSDAPASTALLTGAAVLALAQQGYLNKAIERMCPNGRIPTEAEVVAIINLLLQPEANVQPV